MRIELVVPARVMLPGEWKEFDCVNGATDSGLFHGVLGVPPEDSLFSEGVPKFCLK